MERKFVVYEKSTEYVCSNRASKLPEKCQTASYSYVYQQFTNKGFHYISQPDKFWAGLWSDLVIEQIMMGSFKSLGGLARGQGMDKNTRNMWVTTLHSCAEVEERVCRRALINCQSSEKNEELHRLKRLWRSIKISWLA